MSCQFPRFSRLSWHSFLFLLGNHRKWLHRHFITFGAPWPNSIRAQVMNAIFSAISFLFILKIWNIALTDFICTIELLTNCFSWHLSLLRDFKTTKPSSESGFWVSAVRCEREIYMPLKWIFPTRVPWNALHFRFHSSRPLVSIRCSPPFGIAFIYLASASACSPQPGRIP